jgi:hypothetical protein
MMFISQKKGQELGVQVHHRTNSRILSAIEEATNAVTTSQLASFDEIQHAEDLYTRSKELYETLPHSRGSLLAKQHVMRLHRFIVDSRRVLNGDDFDKKTNFIVNLIHKASEKLDVGNTERAMQLYSKAHDVFASLPAEATLQHKQDDIQMHLKELYNKILFHKEIDQDKKANKVLHSLDVLLNRCQDFIATNKYTDKKTAEELFKDIQKVYSGMQIPETMLWKKAELKKKVEEIHSELTRGIRPERQTSETCELVLSDELQALITADHGLKSHKKFEAFVQHVREIETCGFDHFNEAREHFEQAKNLAIEIQNNNKAHAVVTACLTKIRWRFEIMAGLEKVKYAKHRSAMEEHLALVQRNTLEYNKQYPNEQVFTDRIYEKCAVLHGVLDKGVTIGEILDS